MLRQLLYLLMFNGLYTECYLVSENDVENYDHFFGNESLEGRQGKCRYYNNKRRFCNIFNIIFANLKI